MEILIPSLALLLAAVAFSFFVLPKLAPTILMASSAVVLAIAIYMHVNQFGVMEYERSTWQNNLRSAYDANLTEYTSYIMFGVILMGAYGFYYMNKSNGSMPSITTPTIGGGFDDVMRTAVSRVNQLMRKGRISE